MDAQMDGCVCVCIIYIYIYMEVRLYRYTHASDCTDSFIEVAVAQERGTQLFEEWKPGS